jgi:nicotinamidase/pyrazinamidase
MSVGLIVCDPQYDYLPGGSIDAYHGASALVECARLAAQADLVIVTRDWHPENHFSFSEAPLFDDQSWPPHCVQGTKGAKIFPALKRAADFTISKGMNRNPPDDYSAFNGKTLRPVQRLDEVLYDSPVDDLIVAGFLFETGVKCTAFDANALGWWKSVTIPLDCVGTLREESEQQSDIDSLRKAGIKVIPTWNEFT